MRICALRAAAIILRCALCALHFCALPSHCAARGAPSSTSPSPPLLLLTPLPLITLFHHFRRAYGSTRARTHVTHNVTCRAAPRRRALRIFAHFTHCRITRAAGLCVYRVTRGARATRARARFCALPARTCQRALTAHFYLFPFLSALFCHGVG